MLAAARLRRDLDAELAPLGLNAQRYSALGYIAAVADLSYSDLARRSGVAPQTAFALVRALRRDGLVVADRGHQRGSPARLALTDDGRQALQDAREAFRAVADRLLADLSPRQAAELRRALSVLVPSPGEGAGQPGPTTRALDLLEPTAAADVRSLAARAQTADGNPPLSDHVLLRLGTDGGLHLLVRGPERLEAYAHLLAPARDGSVQAELVVDPQSRGRGVGRALLRDVLGRARGGRVEVWAHGDGEAASRLAAGFGMRRGRVLLQMRRPLPVDLPAPRLPDGVAVRVFRPGEDEAAWLELNNRAFARHPDQGGWGPAEILAREAEPWFDPSGFLLAERLVDGVPVLVGSIWTKVPGRAGAARGSGAAVGPLPGIQAAAEIGEVYVVAVDPSEQGRGLGSALTHVGLRHLESVGLQGATLYVDESNGAAVATYERLGFVRYAVDVMYVRD